MKKSRHDNLDYASLLKQKEARMERLKNSKNPFIICTFLKTAVNQTDTQLYNTLYKFNTQEELQEFSLPFSSRTEDGKKKKTKTTVKSPEVEDSLHEQVPNDEKK